MIISQLGPVELINLEAGEMGQLWHHKCLHRRSLLSALSGYYKGRRLNKKCVSHVSVCVFIACTCLSNVHLFSHTNFNIENQCTVARTVLDRSILCLFSLHLFPIGLLHGLVPEQRFRDSRSFIMKYGICKFVISCFAAGLVKETL